MWLLFWLVLLGSPFNQFVVVSNDKLRSCSPIMLFFYSTLGYASLECSLFFDVVAPSICLGYGSLQLLYSLGLW